jgi:flagellar basal body-associated protein FliL
MLLAILTLFSGLAISAVAIYYSVLGLASIFAAAVIPIVIMGTILELSKLVAAWWLKVNWHRAPFLLKSYMLIAVLILMVITSMGIFGFLSRAHSDQAIPTGDVVSQVAIFDEKIKTQRDNIDAARKALAQMDAQVDARLNRSDDDRGAERAVQIRRTQARERTALQAEIAKAQTEIAALNEQKAPIASQLRAVEAEVGAIKYIAKLIYGENPDANLLEKAVTWVIIIIVLVFDPLAVLLLLSSQLSFQWYRQEKEQKQEQEKSVPKEDTEQDVEEFFQRGKLVARGLDADENSQRAEEANALIAEIERETPEVILPEEKPVEPKVEEPVTKPVDTIVEPTVEVVAPVVEDDTEIIEAAEINEKAAMQRWKAEHPNSSVKHQRHLLEIGVISQLPWEQYLEPEEVDEDQQAAVEAARWAQEQIDASKKKDSDLDGENNGSTSQTNSGGITGYVQNAEQSNETLWQRVKKAKEQ